MEQHDVKIHVLQQLSSPWSVTVNVAAKCEYFGKVAERQGKLWWNRVPCLNARRGRRLYRGKVEASRRMWGKGRHVLGRVFG